MDYARNKKNNPWLVPNLWQHNRDEVIGGVKALTEDSRGVIYETQFAMGIKRAQDAFELAEMKMIGSSYGYDPIRFDIQRNNIRNLKENRLREISQVSFPANDLADIISTKQVWAWSHVPTQAAKVFDSMAASIKSGEHDKRAASTPSPALGGKKQSAQAKSSTFSEMWDARRMSQVRMQLYSMCDILTSSILGIADDDDVSNTSSAIATTISQFSSEVTGSWLDDFNEADVSEDASESSGGSSYDAGMGYMHADLSMVALKKCKELTIKAGKTLSAANKQKISGSISAVWEELQSIQKWLDSLEHNPDDDLSYIGATTSDIGKSTQASTSHKGQPPSETPRTSAPNNPTLFSSADILKQVTTLFGK